ncbi:DUF2339 domain-containing protein [Bacillus luteolus]|uniref:DUF2339 domain-containing protein n=1 Tax=Litchfieldia luteola TaxID=682179 RepID=A0ABR9QIP1_9BACI|nr:bZIP transcription factor [Cytobacillus luteolus]MBE4908346.1 DUF2339 domain-containing protein [Cytobacillus luteolus]MBP1943134.1 putative membrane protein [Cytobacillus luteolus]
MSQKKTIEELEKKVDALQREARDLKVMILELKREEKESQTDRITEPTPDITNYQKDIKSKGIVREEREPIDWERQIGQIWLPRIFIFVLLLGVIWAFKAASDYGYLNNSVKITIGYLSAVILLYIGGRQIRSNRVALGQVLFGGSTILLLIVTFAMHVLYNMVPLLVALVLNLIWIGMGIYFSHLFKSQPLAVLTGIGGYLIPFLLKNNDPNILNLVIFETIFYCILLLFALKKQFKILYLVSFVMLHITLLASIAITGSGQEKTFGIAVLIQHGLLVATFFLKKDFMKYQMGVLYTSFILTMSWVGLSFPETQYEMIVLLTFALYSFLSIISWNKDTTRIPITLSISTLALLLFLISKFDEENIMGLIVLQGLLSIYIGILASSKLQQAVGASIYVLSGLVIISTDFYSIASIDFLNWVVLLGTLIVVVRLLPSVEVIKENEITKVRQIIHIVFMVLLLPFITHTVQALTHEFTLNIKYMAVSSSWGIYAFIGVILGSIKNYKPLRVFGLILLFITLAKLFFVDLTYVSIFIRAVLFIGLGILGIIGSRILYKNEYK